MPEFNNNGFSKHSVGSRKSAFTLAEVFSPHSVGCRKSAFTLAEVLITLGIIGVVAAMTLPTVIANYQKQQTVAELQKIYTVLSQAIKLSEIENGNNQDWETTTITPQMHFERYYKPYLNVSKVCTTYSDCGYKIDRLKLQNGNFDWYVVVPNSSVALILQDGTYLRILSGYSSSTYSNSILIDINGGKNPNMNGKDVFLLTRTEGGLMPFNPNSLYNDCKKNKTCYDCLTKIIQDGWKIKDDYPW